MPLIPVHNICWFMQFVVHISGVFAVFEEKLPIEHEGTIKNSDVCANT